MRGVRRVVDAVRLIRGVVAVLRGPTAGGGLEDVDRAGIADFAPVDSDSDIVFPEQHAAAVVVDVGAPDTVAGVACGFVAERGGRRAAVGPAAGGLFEDVGAPRAAVAIDCGGGDGAAVGGDVGGVAEDVPVEGAVGPGSGDQLGVGFHNALGAGRGRVVRGRIPGRGVGREQCRGERGLTGGPVGRVAPTARGRVEDPDGAGRLRAAGERGGAARGVAGVALAGGGDDQGAIAGELKVRAEQRRLAGGDRAAVRVAVGRRAGAAGRRRGERAHRGRAPGGYLDGRHLDPVAVLQIEPVFVVAVGHGVDVDRAHAVHAAGADRERLAVGRDRDGGAVIGVVPRVLAVVVFAGGRRQRGGDLGGRGGAVGGVGDLPDVEPARVAEGAGRAGEDPGGRGVLVPGGDRAAFDGSGGGVLVRGQTFARDARDVQHLLGRVGVEVEDDQRAVGHGGALADAGDQRAAVVGDRPGTAARVGAGSSFNVERVAAAVEGDQLGQGPADQLGGDVVARADD